MNVDRGLLLASKWLILSGVALLFAMCDPSVADDWPMWRKDASRTACATDDLPATLQLLWSRDYPAPRPAWPEDPRLMFDASYEPVVVGQTMFLASAQTNSVTALDTNSGLEKWRFYAEGPVRFAPIVHKNQIYFGSDDGNLYCLDAQNGQFRWKINAAPTDRKAIGNDRLISVWPIRGGPVLHQDKIYFTAGVWPFEGTFLVSVDLTDTTIPPAFDVKTLPTNLLPQGYLAASGQNLLIPCGRGKVRRFDLSTQKLRNINYDSRTLTDYHVTASGRWMFHGNVVVDLVDNRTVSLVLPRPVADGSVLYSGVQAKVVGGADLSNPRKQEVKNGKGKIVTQQRFDAWGLTPDLFPGMPVTNELGEQIIRPVHIAVKSGSRLYGYVESRLFAIEIPTENSPRPDLAWSKTLSGNPSSIIAADGKLFVTTHEGTVMCFGGESAPAKQPVPDKPAELVGGSSFDDSAFVTGMLEATHSTDGFCIVLGVENGQLIAELVRRTNMRLLVVDQDSERINELREHLTDRDLYGTRVEAYAGDPANFPFPPYLANLIVSENWSRAGLDDHDRLVEKIFSALRPYGGVACIQGSDGTFEKLLHSKDKLSRAEVTQAGQFVLLSRVGALEGAGDWTDEYGNPANTLMSAETLAKPPFGVLWFGGPASHPDLFYDRHQWASSAIIVEGRMFIEGPQKLTAVDVYTGRILWQIPLKEGLSPGRRANWESTGFHFLATSDRVYMTYEKACQVFDAATGRRIGAFTLPDPKLSFGRIRIWKDRLIVPAFTDHPTYGPIPNQLIAMDRQTGEIQWTIDSEFSFPFVALGEDKLFVFEGLLANLYNNQQRKGLIPKSEPQKFLAAFDLQSGQPVWREPTSRVVTWLAYSRETDVVVASDITGIEAWQGSAGAPLWTKDAKGTGFAGHPENLWDKVILWHDRLIDQRGPGRSYDLVTGERKVEIHPISGNPGQWEFTKVGHHCNYAIASENVMTFRADSAGYLDLDTGGTSHLRGFRSGCRNSLIPANGILNAPNFANGCVCSYSLFTSLAMIHVPEAEKWSYSAIKPDNQPIKRVGINFGAPGDRRDGDGTLWLDFPSVGGSSPDVDVFIVADKSRKVPIVPPMGPMFMIDKPLPQWFRQHASQIDGGQLAWVGSSGGEGITKIRIPLKNVSDEMNRYRVRLFFAEPAAMQVGQRVFDVALGGETVVSGFDIASEAGNQPQMITKQFTVEATRQLVVELKPVKGRPVISGIEIVAD